MRSRQAFYQDLLRYEADIKKTGAFATGVYLVVASFLVLSLFFGLGSYMNGVLVLGLTLLYVLALFILKHRLAKKHLMVCTSCFALLNLNHIGITGKCDHCDTQLLIE